MKTKHQVKTTTTTVTCPTRVIAKCSCGQTHPIEGGCVDTESGLCDLCGKICRIEGGKIVTDGKCEWCQLLGAIH